MLNFFLDILNTRKAEFSTSSYQDCFFANPSGKLGKLLDCMLEDKGGCVVLLSWMEPHAVEFISNKITKEMDEVEVALKWKINTITPESLLTWDIDSFIGLLVEKSAPILSHLLQVAAQIKRAKENNKIKLCITVCMSILITRQID